MRKILNRLLAIPLTILLIVSAPFDIIIFIITGRWLISPRLHERLNKILNS